MSKTTCPVFRPTMEEFSNFSQYIDKIDSKIGDYGACKIIPPKGWYETRTPEDVEKMFDRMKIMVPPIKQCVSGLRGVYQLALIESRKLSVAEFRKLAEENEPDVNTSYEDMERNFWRSMGPMSPPSYYGADMMGSVFGDDDAGGWNLNKLDNMIKLLPTDLPGITTAMLYFGTWRAMFAFHTEDMNLYSINYLHTGRPKSWYSIPPNAAKRFESMAQSFNPQLFHECSEYLRHKTTMISPKVLKDCGIPFHTVVQEPGEFVITFPASYHAGFNHGFNVAEATNFTTERWIPKGREAKWCKCQPYSVHIDMNHFMELLQAKRNKDREKTEHLAEKKREKAMKKLLYTGWLEWQQNMAAQEKEAAARLKQERERLAKERKAAVVAAAAVAAAEEMGDTNPEPMMGRRMMGMVMSGHETAAAVKSADTWVDDDEWDFRCCCGQECRSTDPFEAWPKGMMFQCTGCGFWSHTKCVYNRDDKIPHQAFCYVCLDTLQRMSRTLRGRQDQPPEDSSPNKTCYKPLRTGSLIKIKSRVLVCRSAIGLAEVRSALGLAVIGERR